MDRIFAGMSSRNNSKSTSTVDMHMIARGERRVGKVEERPVDRLRDGSDIVEGELEDQYSVFKRGAAPSGKSGVSLAGRLKERSWYVGT